VDDSAKIPLLRIIQAIGRAYPKQIGREQTWLSATLNVKVQAVNNWRQRGVPPHHVAEIARALNCSMEQVVGAELPTPSGWPFERVPFSEFNRLTERQKGVVEQAMLDAIEKVQQAPVLGQSEKEHLGAAA
jgi:hypothetical protein